MQTHDPREELHDEDLVVQGELFIVVVQYVVELFAKGLGIAEELEGGEVGVGFVALFRLVLGGFELLSDSSFTAASLPVDFALVEEPFDVDALQKDQSRGIKSTNCHNAPHPLHRCPPLHPHLPRRSARRRSEL